MSDQSFMPDEPEESKPLTKRKKHKPVKVWYKAKYKSRTRFLPSSWFKYGSYKNREIAEEIVKQAKRKYNFYEYYIGDKPNG